MIINTEDPEASDYDEELEEPPEKQELIKIK